MNVFLSRVSESKQMMEGQSNGAAPIEILNDDCLALIFSYFDTFAEKTRLERVCKQWQNILLNSWKSIDNLDLTKNTKIDWGLPYGRFIKRLSIHSLRKILKSCGGRLQRIDTSDNRELSRDMIENVGEFCPNLECVVITDCSWAVLDGEKSLATCKKLTKIIIKNVINESFLIKIFSKLMNLRSIEIHGHSGHCSIGSSFFNLPKVIEEIILEKVGIDGLSFNQAIQTLPNLRAINLNDCMNVNGRTLESISSAKSLRELKLHGNLVLTEIPEIVPQLIPNIQNLEVIEFPVLLKGKNQYFQGHSGITDENIEDISMTCRNLRSLDMSGSSNVTDAGINALSSCLNLEKLIINYVIRVTDQSIANISNLKVLQCAGCNQVRDGGIISLIEKTPSLEILDISLTSVTSKTIGTAVETVARRENDVPLILYVGFPEGFTKKFPDFVNVGKLRLLEIVDESLMGNIKVLFMPRIHILRPELFAWNL